MPTTKLLGCQSTKRVAEEELTAVHRMLGISSLHFLKLVEDRGHVGFWSMDFATDRITGTIGMYRLLGLPPSTTLDFSELLKMMHPNDRLANSDTIAVIRSGQPIKREFRVIRLDRTMRWIENKAEVLVDAEGIPRSALGLFTDVTEQHEARVTVEEGWQSYNSLISAIAAAKWRMLPSGKITVLVKWEELTGQTLAEADDWGWVNAVRPDEQRDVFSLWEKCSVSARPYAIALHVRNVDGYYRKYLMQGASLLNSDGSCREWIFVLIETPVDPLVEADRFIGRIDELDVSYIRAARGLLNWSVEDLSRMSGVSASTIRRIERSAGFKTRLPHIETIVTALQKGGVCFGHNASGQLNISLAAVDP